MEPTWAETAHLILDWAGVVWSRYESPTGQRFRRHGPLEDADWTVPEELWPELAQLKDHWNDAIKDEEGEVLYQWRLSQE